MAQTRVGPADDSRRMKRSISKPEEVSHKDLLVGGVLFRVPAEFVITSQRHRKAIDPSTFLGPTMLSRRLLSQVHNGEGMVSHDSVVVKVIPKHILRSPDEKQSVIREQVIHKSCRHPHIIRLIDTYQDDRAANGSMEHRIGHMGIPEDDAKNVFRQLLLALEYLHANCIVHHDLKPHNLLLDASGQLKVCDFGAARAYNKHERGLPFSGIYGTVGYIGTSIDSVGHSHVLDVAPELLQSTPVYTTAVDMFSAGLILFEMLFAYAAFYPPSACMRDEVEFPMPRPSQRHKSQVSTQAKDLIQALLQKDPAMRATAAAALRHPWFHTKNA
ncbi:hypothetical protein DYB32_005149 [Aphanomyces invadans]|uniref:Protein kinase domain-containing protein n=1 Tax=Aphanomyces invadans TaxID=157072 RepID=A0A418AVF3_9STRA|nr:hypothetical protein DYB32_005149 [Aphanomyces invadans]